VKNAERPRTSQSIPAGQRGVARARGTILIGDGCTKQRHHPISGDLVHHPLVSVDSFHHELCNTVKKNAGFLGITICYQALIGGDRRTALKAAQDRAFGTIIALALVGELLNGDPDGRHRGWPGSCPARDRGAGGCARLRSRDPAFRYCSGPARPFFAAGLLPRGNSIWARRNGLPGRPSRTAMGMPEIFARRALSRARAVRRRFPSSREPPRPILNGLAHLQIILRV
jgi:hypothetical protein